MGEEEHEIILQKVQAAKVGPLADPPPPRMSLSSDVVVGVGSWVDEY